MFGHFFRPSFLKSSYKHTEICNCCLSTNGGKEGRGGGGGMEGK